MHVDIQVCSLTFHGMRLSRQPSSWASKTNLKSACIRSGKGKNRYDTFLRRYFPAPVVVKGCPAHQTLSLNEWRAFAAIVDSNMSVGKDEA